MGPVIVETVRRCTQKPLNMHLMVTLVHTSRLSKKIMSAPPVANVCTSAAAACPSALAKARWMAAKSVEVERRDQMKVGRAPRGCNRTLADLVLSETRDFLRDRNVSLEVVFVKSNKDGHWYLRRDLADATALLKELHRIVNEAIRTQTVGDDQAEGLTFEEVQPAS